MRSIAELWPMVDTRYDAGGLDIDGAIEDLFYDGVISWDEAVSCIEFLNEMDGDND